MPETLIARLSEAVGRRGFLRTVSAASAALTMGVLNIKTTEASGIDCGPTLFNVGCCCVCLDPRTCSYSDCVCEWSWTCTHYLGPEPIDQPPDKDAPPDSEPKLPINPCPCQRFTCKECYSAATVCVGCTGIKCSKATFRTIICACP